MRLSIVLGTYNRLSQLTRCLESIGRYCAGNETIVVDGGSTDGTLDYLWGQPVKLIQQGELLGACRAFNAGFAVARGEYVLNFNDDAYLTDNAAMTACDLLDGHPDVGQIALPFSGPKPQLLPRADHTMPLAGKRWLYANFGVTRRKLGDRLFWWGTDYHTYGGDAELSMKIWNVGYTVALLRGAHIIHEETQDELRRPNTDSPKFYAKWRQWKGPGDPDPRFGDRDLVQG
jgi:GT2 family glycosyltransferase